MHSFSGRIVSAVLAITLCGSFFTARASAQSCDQICSSPAAQSGSTMTNGQLGAQCAAYKGADESEGPEKMVMMLDLGVAALCGYACFAEKVNPSLFKMCNMGAMGAGLAELVATLNQKNGGVMKWIGAAGAAYATYQGAKNAGIVDQIMGDKTAQAEREVNEMNRASVNDNVGKAEQDYVQASDEYKGYSTGGGSPDEIAASKRTMDTAKADLDKAQAAQKDAYKKDKEDSCKTAMTFALMGGMRAFASNKQDDTKEKACDQVQQLASQAAVPSAAGGMTGGSAGGSVGGSAAVQNGLTCVATNGGIGSCVSDAGKVTSASTDAGIMTRSGLDRAAAPLALSTTDKLGNRLNGKVDAGAILGSMAGNLGDFGNLMTKAAEWGQKNGEQFLGVVPSSVMTSSGRGGGSRGGKDDLGLGDITAMLGGLGKKGGAPIGGSGASHFGTADDIFHSRSSSNIFEIVSGRILKVTHRVQ